MTYRIVKGKIVICNKGVYFPLADDEIDDLRELIREIKSGDETRMTKDNR